MSNGERILESGKWWTRLVVVVLVAVTSTLFVVHSPLPALAQAPSQAEIPPAFGTRNLNLRFTHLTLEDGLSQSSVLDIVQDRHGYMWFATEGGLNRFDGFEIESFYHIPFDSTSLAYGRQWALAESKDGSLWVGGASVISRMDPVTHTFKRYQMPPGGGGPLYGLVLTLIESTDGVIWAGTARRGLARLDPDGASEISFYQHDPEDEVSLPRGPVVAVFEDSRQQIWIKTPGTLSRIEPQNAGHFEHFQIGDDFLPHMWLSTGMYERPSEEGVLWVGTYDGLVRFDTDSHEIRRYRVDEADSEPVRIGSIAADPSVRGVLWVGLDDGIARFDIQTGAFVRYGHDDANPSSLAPSPVTTLEVDRQGVLWIGTRAGGVDRLNPAAVGFELVGARGGGEGLFEGHGVRPIHLTRDNVLVVGSSRRAEADRSLLTFLDRSTGRAEQLRIEPTDTESVQLALDIFEDAAGTLWIGGVGLAQFDRDTRQFEYVAPDPDDPEQSIPEQIWCIIQDRRGFLWLAGSALSRMDPHRPGQVTRFAHDPDDPQSLPEPTYIDVAEDASGYIWVTSSSQGLARFDPTTGKADRYIHDPSDPSTIASNTVYDVLVPARDSGVIYATGSGLSRLDVEAGTFTNYTVADGLPSQTVYGALEDERGRVWMSTNGGISRFDPETGTFRNYGMEAGLQSLEFNGESLHKGHNGEMFFGGINGLNAFFPNALIESSEPPEARVVGIRIGDVPVSEVRDLEIGVPIPEMEQLTLNFDQRDVSIDFNGFHYQHPEKNRFEYMLDGYSDDWTHAATRRSASFTNLAPGDYTFRMRASNSDGIWSEEEARLNLTILPPWWRSWWAYLLYGLVVVAGIVTVDRVQRRRLHKEERERAREQELKHAREIEEAYNELRTTQDRLIQSEKMASLGQLTAGIAHEIKNPLNFVNNFSELSKELAEELLEEIEERRSEIPDDLVTEIEDILAGLKLNVEKINEHGKRADSIVYGMLQHSRTGESERAETDINALVDEHLNLAYHGMRAREPDFNAILETDYDEAVGSVEVLPQELGRVMLNLIGNAFDALYELQVKGWKSDKDPKLTVSTRKNGENVEIRIADNGPGIPDDVKSKIFEPFFTTKPTGSGTGLGLSMSYDIVTKGHGGELEVISGSGEGATFMVKLPTS